MSTEGSPPDAAGAAEFAERRRRVLDVLRGHGALLLPAASAAWPGREGEPPYVPDRELYYLTGWRAPGAVALLNPADDDAPYRMFAAPREAAEERWNGARPGPEEAREEFAADAAHPLSDLADLLARVAGQVDTVYFRLGAHRDLDPVLIDTLAHARKARRRTGLGALTVSDPGLVLDPMRRVKSEAELTSIRRAASITVEAFREAWAAIRPGAGEWEVEAALEAGFRGRGADGPAFGTIVASGANAVVLHYTRNDARMQHGLVLLDAGAQVDLYAADVSRTFAVGAPSGGAVGALHEVVREAQRAAIGACRPGSDEESVHAAAHAVLMDGARDLGLLPAGAKDESPEKDLMPHRTSHWLGLAVHDPGDYATVDGPVPFEPGMVLTVEPGLYVRPDHPNAPKELRGVGVRIEDDVAITPGGAEVLTGELPTGQIP